MSNTFQGVWGTFEFLDDTAGAIEALREQGEDISVYSPCPRHEIETALGNPQSKIPFVTLIFGAVGIFFGYALPTWTAMDWVLPVSSKPIVSIPPFTIFAFELMVLLGGVSTAFAIFLMGNFVLSRKKMPKSEQFKNYNRFSGDRFGVVVRCSSENADKVEKILRDHHSEEVVREL